jgi:hypothetical protein
MRLPSLSIAEMMVIVAVVGFDCWAIRGANKAPIIPFLGFGGLPMQIALMIGLLVFRRRIRMRKPSSFLLGFEVAGWIANLSYVVLCLYAVSSLDSIISYALSPLLSATRLPRFSTLDYALRVVLGMLALTAPQLALAWVAGWINQKRNPEDVAIIGRNAPRAIPGPPSPL